MKLIGVTPKDVLKQAELALKQASALKIQKNQTNEAVRLHGILHLLTFMAQAMIEESTISENDGLIKAISSSDPDYPGIRIEIEGRTAVLVESTPEGFQVVRYQEDSDDALDIRKWANTP